MLILVIFSGITLAADRVSLGFIYEATDSIELVDRTNGSINQVSPTCLNLDSKGNLIVTKDLTHEFVAAMKEREILVIPFLSNHWVRSKGKAAIENTEQLTEQIVEVINEYDLDGINVDLENLTPNDKDGLSNFVRILREKMPSNKILTVSVAANPDGKDVNWQGSYDYEKLGKYSDYLFVMTYDEHSQGGICGPVASLDFVKKSIEYTLNYVSRDKIVIGIPLYGRYWKENEEIGGEAVVIGAIPTLISKNKGIVKYDTEIGEACVTFTVDNSKIKSKINGKVLEDGEYTIWYQTEESIKSKLNLVNEYDLLGAGVWALGQEKVDVWTYYKNELNRIPYESEEEEKKREEYEALVVDLSNLELFDIISISNVQVKENEFKNINENTTNKKILYEEHYHINEPKISIENVTESTRQFLGKENKKMKIRAKSIIQNENRKQLHIYKYCKKIP